jgi:hypothetical protein
VVIFKGNGGDVMATQQVSGGIGVAGALTIVFVIFKLLDKIDWSWWWVLSPLWISFGLGMFLLFVGLLLVAIFAEK